MDSANKYIYSAADDTELLLAVGTAVDETHNLAADPAYGEIVHRLRATLVERFRSDGYTEPLDGTDWRRYPPSTSAEADPDDRDDSGRGRQYAR